MNIYSILVILIFLSAFLSRNSKDPKRSFIVLSCFLLFFVLGLRDAYSIGNDSASSYLVNFERLGKMDWKEIAGRGEYNQNIGFQYLTKFLYIVVDGNYQWYIIIISAIIIIAFGHFVSRYSPNPLQSVLYYLGLLLYIGMFNILKQGIAMSIILIAYDAVVDRRMSRFLILTLIATLIHFPAAIFLPAYWLVRVKLNRIYLVILVVLLVLTYYFREQLVTTMLNLYEENEYNFNMEDIQFLRTKALLMIAIVVTAVFLRPPTVEDYIYCSLLKFMGIAIVFQTFCGYSNVFERLADYYFQFAVVFLPMMFEKVNLKRQYFSVKARSIIFTVGSIAFCSFAIWRFLDRAMNNPFIYPYKFFFQSTHVEQGLMQIHGWFSNIYIM